MEKTCTKCNTSKPLTEFYKNKKTFLGVTAYCKQCIKDGTNIPYKNDKNFRETRLVKGRDRYYTKLKTGIHHVYLLPKENYVGVTEFPSLRILDRHKNHYKRNIEGWRILHSTKIRDEALELEELLHDMGYNGRHAHNSYK